MRLKRCAVSRLSKPCSLACRNSVEMIVAMTTSATSAHSVENATTRKASEFARFPSAEKRPLPLTPFKLDDGEAMAARSIPRLAHAIAHAAHRLDQVDAHLSAQPADEDLYRVGIAVEVLVIEMLDQLRARYDL